MSRRPVPPAPADAPADRPERPVPFAAPAARGSGSGADAPNARDGHGAPGAEQGGGQDAQPRASRRGGQDAKGGPGEREGGRPKCGSRTVAEGVLPPSTDIPHISAFIDGSHPGDTPPVFDEIPGPIDSISTLPDVDIPPEESVLPPPGTLTTQPKLGKFHGRDPLTGKVLPHERDPEIAQQVAKWVACGAGVNEIASYLGIRVGQLKKHYARELEHGQFEANMQVGNTIFELAKMGVPQMSIFWAKSRMGWRDSDKADTNNTPLLNIHIHE